MNWRTTISNFWELVRNFDWRTVIVAGTIAFVSFFVAARSSLISLENTDSGLIGNLVLGTSFLIGGIFLFGLNSMGLIPKESSFQKMGIIIIFLLATILLNFLGAPIKSIEVSHLHFVQVIVTGFWEETVFRGFIFALWGNLFGLRLSISVSLLLLSSSLLFGVVHLNQGIEIFIIRSSLGFLLGVVTLYTQTFSFAILLHALHNGLTMVIKYNGNPDTSLQIILLFLLCIVGWYCYSRNINPTYPPIKI